MISKKAIKVMVEEYRELCLPLFDIVDVLRKQDKLSRNTSHCVEIRFYISPENKTTINPSYSIGNVRVETSPTYSCGRTFYY